MTLVIDEASPLRRIIAARQRVHGKGSGPDDTKVRSGRCCKGTLFMSILAAIVAMIVVNHPRTRILASELLTPAEKLILELDNWGNFTFTSKLKLAMLEVINSTRAKLEGELPFYMDIIYSPTESSPPVPGYPLLFIPGIVTGGLEVWASLPCANAKFRERIWGTASMLKLFITDPRCWVQHMLMHPHLRNVTMDNGSTIETLHFDNPQGVKIKPTSGLAAADFLLGDYWVWNPIIEALGFAGYEETNMSMMAYDWRLPIRDLEVRDKLMSHIKLEVEKLFQLNDDKPVLIVTHSYGCKVWFFFMQWVVFHHAPEWLSTYVYGSYNIAPAYLGVPKAFSALLSGDTRDTAHLGAMATLLDTVLPPSERSALTSSWGSITDMLPSGGVTIWPEPLLHLKPFNSTYTSTHSVDEAIHLLMKTHAMRPHAIHRKGSIQFPNSLRCPTNTSSKRTCYKDTWGDPLLAPLPNMTSKIWVAHGTGIPTEIGYYYYSTSKDPANNCAYRVNVSATGSPSLVDGIILGDGDGTVPLQSLAHVPNVVWKPGAAMNPAGVEIRVRTLNHGESYSVLSRASSVGGSSVDHVDIMGNRIVIRDILQIALGKESKMEDIHTVSGT